MKKINLNSFQIPSVLCPVCSYELSGATNTKPDGGPPKTGDISICVDCGTILEFQPDDTLRPVDLNETLEWPQQERRKIFLIQGEIHRRGRIPKDG